LPDERKPGLAAAVNDTLLVIGYGSLLSGYGILAERRGGKSRLIARDAFPVRLDNARRGLAKPSSHGHYLAMDLEPIDPAAPIAARAANGHRGTGIGALGLVFDRQWAPLIARREEYDETQFLRLLEIADRAGQPLGEFLLDMARQTKWSLLEYRRALYDLLGYTSEGYIFHPAPFNDGRVAIAAIGSGFEGSGDSSVRSKRNEYGMDRLLTLAEAMRVDSFDLDHDGQVGYFVECLLGGWHGLDIHDLTAGLEPNLRDALKTRMATIAPGENERFLRATSLDNARYRANFTVQPHPALAPVLPAAAR
jgi:hypothetical protein